MVFLLTESLSVHEKKNIPEITLIMIKGNVSLVTMVTIYNLDTKLDLFCIANKSSLIKKSKMY